MSPSASRFRWFVISPFLVASSGAPFNITLGQDLNGDSIFNDRPAFATSTSGPNVVTTQYGTFDTNPASTQTIIPPNIASGPPQFSLNLRLAKTFGFGKKVEGSGASGGFGGPGGGGGGGPRGGGPPGGGLGPGGLSGSGGRPPAGMFGGGANRRYNLEFSIMARNVFNNVNLAPPIGTLNSPLFGRSNAIVGGFGGGQGANRSINLQARFSF